MKPSEIIDAALTDVIPTEAQWGQGSFRYTARDGQDKCCLLGALGYAATGSYTAASPARRIDYPELEMVCTQLQYLADTDHLPAWNDENDYEAVRALMEKGRAALQELGQ